MRRTRYLVPVSVLLLSGTSVLVGPIAQQAAALTMSRNHGGVVTFYTGHRVDDPAGIASGLDGSLWFTNLANNSIGKITTAGTISNYTGTGINGSESITLGPDGALWFTNYSGRAIGRITKSGVVT